MAPLVLEGDTLGEKHKNFNRLVQDSVANKYFNLTKINYDESDLDNLLKIDTASKTKNIDYIIDVLKCDDMLYISRAIKQSTWLITEQEYSHIINPEYLHTQLFPHMLTKAINKLLLHIRLHLKDEKRAEAFYDYLKNTSNEANKWLLICSIPFVENVLQNEGLIISLQLYKRLCKRSIVFLKYYEKLENGMYWRALKAVMFLVKSNTEEYLDFLELQIEPNFPTFDKKYTEYIMKKVPNRILDNFDKYKSDVDSSTVAKYMKKEDIKDFLLRSAKNKNMEYFLSNYDKIKHFIKNMPEEDRFEFVKNIYIDKIGTAPAPGEYSAGQWSYPSCSVKLYNWYQYASFNVAFIELKKLIRAESSPAERCVMLSMLITCARKNAQHTKTLLQYYYDKHRNEPTKFKIQFINNLINQMPTYEFDRDTWNILNNLFHGVEIYIESENENTSQVQTCLKAIILYKILHNEEIPIVVEKKYVLDTFKEFQNKLNEDQRNKIFSYLLTVISSKIQNKKIITESDFTSIFDTMKAALGLLLDWRKEIKQYAFVLDKIQELIKINKQNLWNIQLAALYNMNKSWRRDMFEESITLSPCEEVCLNALKHKPGLLAHYSDEMEALRTNDNISLKRLLGKLRIYWPHSLAQQWTDLYLNNMDKSTGQKAVIKGLFVLLPQNRIIVLVKKYVPQDSKIEWSEIDQTEFSLRKNIAKSLHIARPLITLDVVLWYAKGDYLQYVVPSLNAMLYNINKIHSRDQLSKLLDAPVSLQKHGLHLAFIKLKFDELKPIFINIWKTTKNSSIRTQLFTYTYNLLCKQKEESVARDLWELLCTFIDKLTPDENMIIFSKLGNAERIPLSVRGQFIMKSYEFLASLPAGANCETHKRSLITYAPNVMHLLDPLFVDKLLAPTEENFSKPSWLLTDLMTSYVLHGKTDDEQCERYNRTIVPALEHAFRSWNVIKNDEYIMQNNVDNLIKSFICDFQRFSAKKTIIVPVKLFSEIKRFMKQNISIEENYGRYTTWKLTSEYVNLVAEHKDILYDSKLDHIPSSDFDRKWLPDDAERVWEALHIKISPKFGKIIVQILKEDTETYFPTICWLFTNSIRTFFSYLSIGHYLAQMETLKYMVFQEDFIPSYLVVCDAIHKYGDDDVKKKRLEIRNIISAHPSKEVQMHYKLAFADITD